MQGRPAEDIDSVVQRWIGCVMGGYGDAGDMGLGDMVTWDWVTW